MIITCPSCETRYTVKSLAAGDKPRKVRCASCGHQWMAEPQGAAPGLPSEPAAAPIGPASHEPAPSSEREAAQAAPAMATAEAAPDRASDVDVYASRPRRSGIEGILTFLIAVALFAAVASAMIYFRAQIVAQVPQAARIYALAGIEVNSVGLEIRNPAWRLDKKGEEQVLLIAGEIVNADTREHSVPSLNLVLRDAKGRELYHWTTPVQGANRLAPGGIVSFTTTLENPPKEAHDVDIRFRPGS